MSGAIEFRANRQHSVVSITHYLDIYAVLPFLVSVHMFYCGGGGMVAYVQSMAPTKLWKSAIL